MEVPNNGFDDKRLEVGGLILPRDTRGAVGSITDKFGSVSEVIVSRDRAYDDTDYVTTSTSWVDIGTPLVFFLERTSNLHVFLTARLKADNGSVDGTECHLRLYDTSALTSRVSFKSWGSYSAWGQVSSWKHESDVLSFSGRNNATTGGIHILQPQIMSDGTGNVTCYEMTYGYQVLGN